MKLSKETIRFIAMLLLPLARTPSGSLREEQLIDELERSKWLKSSERLSVASRTDSRIANYVHNVVSHRGSRTNPIRLGLIEWHSSFSEFTITGKGRDFLDRVARKLGARESGELECINRWLTDFAKRDDLNH